jgi:hypothetical protein
VAIHGHEDSNELPPSLEASKYSPTGVAVRGVSLVCGFRDGETCRKCVGETDRLIV